MCEQCGHRRLRVRLLRALLRIRLIHEPQRRSRLVRFRLKRSKAFKSKQNEMNHG